jgi:hypothetical protein
MKQLTSPLVKTLLLASLVMATGTASAWFGNWFNPWRSWGNPWYGGGYPYHGYGYPGWGGYGYPGYGYGYPGWGAYPYGGYGYPAWTLPAAPQTQTAPAPSADSSK